MTGSTKSWRRGVWSLGSLAGLLPLEANAQLPAVPPEAIAQFERVIGGRVEAATILGGEQAAAGGIYSFRGGTVAELAITKFGGGGDVAAPRPLTERISWAPVLLGNLGRIVTENTFAEGYLAGNVMRYEVLAVQAGGGARFYFDEHLSLAPLISGIYGHTENEFEPHNALGQVVKGLASGTYVDWQADTWSIAPGAEFRYDWRWGRTTFAFTSRYGFYHTESFDASSPHVSVDGDSHTWENKVDADVPLGWQLFGRELHTGGFFSRSEMFGGISDGLNSDFVNTLNGRLVADFVGRVWHLRWFGVGASYFWGDNFGGWSAGVDVRFEF